MLRFCVVGLVFVASTLFTGISAYADEPEIDVVTIYFAGTGITEGWHDGAVSKFRSPELLAELYHDQDAALPTDLTANQYKIFVDGIGTGSFFDLFGQAFPNIDWLARGWNECLDEAEDELQDVLDKSNNKLIVNLIGFSRGGILTMRFAKRIADVDDIDTINILAFDPVPGIFDPFGEMGEDFDLDGKVKRYIGLYGRDERSWMFEPIVPRSLTDQTMTWMRTIPATHEVMVGNMQRDGNANFPAGGFTVPFPHFFVPGHYSTPIWYANDDLDSDLNDNLSTSKVIATELLGSPAWGSVTFVDDTWAGDWLDIPLSLREIIFKEVVAQINDPARDSKYYYMHHFSHTAFFWYEWRDELSYRYFHKRTSESGLMNLVLEDYVDELTGDDAWSMLQEYGNTPPVVDPGGPYTGEEGLAITFDASSSYDPDGSDLMYRWDFDDDGSWDTGWLVQPSASYTWGDDYNGNVVVEVSDGMDTASASIDVTVNNVAPVTTIDAIYKPNPYFVLPVVHTLGASGSFTDPGWLDTHASSWAFGDGGSQPGQLTEENIAPDATGTTVASHAYTTPGSFIIRLTVTDDDGASGEALTDVTVLTAEQANSEIMEFIKSCPDSDFIKNPTQRRRALLSKLENVGMMIQSGDYQDAINKLRNDVEAKSNGSMDGTTRNDWIGTPGTQSAICQMIDDLIAYLMYLQNT